MQTPRAILADSPGHPPGVSPCELPFMRGLPLAPSCRSFRYGFTVLELLVSVSILAVIVFALYQMFHTTQKAMRANVTQVDVMESGRAAMDMIGRELGELSACNLFRGTNFYAGLIPVAPLVQLDLDGKGPLRTNVLEEFLFLSPQTNKWVATGYRIIGAESGVGTLYRFSVATNVHLLNSSNLTAPFWTLELTNRATGRVSTNFHRVADGIVHLKLTAYDFDGQRLGYNLTNGVQYYQILRQRLNGGTIVSDVISTNVVLRQDVADQTQMLFLSNALPAYVDVELGVLEPGTFEQYKSVRDGSRQAAVEFLRKRANKVHLFRQRIPIRTAAQ
jgi:prepilin-type N-terminal cleavage/methylation domain-containing protein